MAFINKSSLSLPPDSNSNGVTTTGTVKQAVYWIIAVVAFLSNSVLCLFLYSQRKVLLKKPYSVIMFALGITDITTAIFLFLYPGYSFPFTIPEPKGTSVLWLYCQVLYGRMALFMCGLASMNLCVLLTMERWFAVAKPTKYMLQISAKRVVIGTVACYILAILTIVGSSPAVRIHPENPVGKRCSYGKGGNLKVLAVIGFLLKTVIPFSIIAGLYMHIIYTLKTASEVGREHNIAVVKKITNVAAIATLMLMVCWTPNQVTYLLFILGYATQGTTWIDISVVLVFFNSCINPVLYGLTMEQYRQGYWRIITSFCPCTRKIHGGAIAPFRDASHGTDRVSAN